MIKIIPAILTNDPNELRFMLSRCEGVVDRVQIDIIDGVYADNKTIDPAILESYETSLKIDYHLMTKNPADWIEKCMRGMADRIIGQVEMMENQTDFIGRVGVLGARVGLALDLRTPISDIDQVILRDLDCVLVMSVPAGFGGQEFDREAIEKIEELDRIRVHDKSPYTILDDGGVTLDFVDDVRLAGVDEVAVGRKLFAGDLRENIEKFMRRAYLNRG